MLTSYAYILARKTKRPQVSLWQIFPFNLRYIAAKP
nr:MAG TPA: hypothetical protein [Caudoviricetes sp.]